MNRFVLCLVAVFASVLMLVAPAVLAPSPAGASPPVDACAARGQEYVVVTYRRGALAMPLRCGSPTWGFRHIVGHLRWSERFDALVALTFSRGEEFDDGSKYVLFDSDCRERFRLIVNPRAFRGVEFRPQGIVTAYETTNWPNSASWSSSSAVTGYRTGCPLFDKVRLPA